MKENTDNTEKTEKKKIPYPHPDWQDLFEWGYENYPEIMQLLRYQGMNAKYDCLLELWDEDGRSTDGFESSLWSKEEALG